MSRQSLLKYIIYIHTKYYAHKKTYIKLSFYYTMLQSLRLGWIKMPPNNLQLKLNTDPIIYDRKCMVK